jgi:polysaccharide biosynthesis protein PslH
LVGFAISCQAQRLLKEDVILHSEKCRLMTIHAKPQADDGATDNSTEKDILDIDTDSSVTRSKPKILFLAHRVPYPPNRGDRIRSFHLLRFLAQRADVSLAFLAEEEPSLETQQALESLCKDVAGVQLGRYRRWIHAAGSLAMGGTATEGLFQSKRLRRLLAGWCKKTRYDAVVVFCSSMVQYLDVPGLADVPVLVDLVDVDSQKWLQYAEEASWAQRMLYRIEGKRLRRLEQSLPSRSKAITLVSQCEAELYKSFCPAESVHAISNGVDLDYFQPRMNTNAGSSQDCVFVGALNYRANVDGIHWFCNEIWPEVLRRNPKATFTIVGSHPSPIVCRLAQLPGIRLACNVPDIRPYVAEAALVVVPLRIARGIQNKVLEALAMGKAVIATPEALEGIAVDPEVHACQALAPAEWIELVVRLLGDASGRDRLGQAGRSFVESHHTWDLQLRPLAPLLGLRELSSDASHGTAPKQDAKNPLASCHG